MLLIISTWTSSIIAEKIQNGRFFVIFSPPFNFIKKRWAIAIEVRRRRRRRRG